MEKTIGTKKKVPSTDSVQELARFWDNHDLTDFEDELEEVTEPVFVRGKGTTVRLELQPAEARRIKEIAQSKGVKNTTLLRQWILERLQGSFSTGRSPKKALQPPARKTRRG